MTTHGSKPTLLHCGPMGMRSYGGRTKEPIEGETLPVFGKTTVFSLPHACLTAGLFDEVSRKDPVNWFILSNIAKRKWDGSLDRFWDAAAKINISPESVKERASSHHGAIIGWLSADRRSTRGPKCRFGICPDLELTLLILGRRIGEIFISGRDPDFSWDNLFATSFECDEDFGSVPSLDEAPWRQYKWQIGKSN